MKRGELIFNILQLPADFIMLVFAGIITYLLRTKIFSVVRPVLFEFNLPFQKWLILVLIVAALFIASYAISGLYSMRTTRNTVEEALKVLVASSAGIMAVIIYIFLRQELFDSRFLVLAGWLMGVVSVLAGRLVMRRVQKYFIAKRNFGVHKVMVIGNDSVAKRLISFMKHDPSLGYRVVKHTQDTEVIEVAHAVGNPGIDEIILTDPYYPQSKMLQLLRFCNEKNIIFKYVPNMYQSLTANATFETFAEVPLVELKRTALDGWGKVIKRMIDIAGAVIGLIIVSPFFLLFALAIKWETKGPVFVRLKRVSQGKELLIYKFRSMVENAEKLKKSLLAYNERRDSPLFKIKDDPRVTKVGSFLRRLRIDELPQLYNVLRGDMSLVGPRPHQPDEIARYEEHHKKVLAVKAGMTGLAQVSGSSDLLFEKEIALDTFYVEHWSFILDIKILLKTILRLLFDRSAV